MKPDFKKKSNVESSGPPAGSSISNNFNLEENFRLPRFQKTEKVSNPAPAGLTAQ